MPVKRGGTPDDYTYQSEYLTRCSSKSRSTRWLEFYLTILFERLWCASQVALVPDGSEAQLRLARRPLDVAKASGSASGRLSNGLGELGGYCYSLGVYNLALIVPISSKYARGVVSVARGVSQSRRLRKQHRMSPTAV